MNGPHRYAPNPDRARAIREARQWAQMSERDLGRALGVAQATVRAWEAAVRDPGPGNVARIAEATRTSVSSLLMPRPRGHEWSCWWDAQAAEWPTSRRAA